MRQSDFSIPIDLKTALGGTLAQRVCCTPLTGLSLQEERDRLQRQTAEQAAMLTEHGSAGKALEAAAQEAAQEAARLRLDLQAAEHQHAQQLVGTCLAAACCGHRASAAGWLGKGNAPQMLLCQSPCSCWDASHTVRANWNVPMHMVWCEAHICSKAEACQVTQISGVLD